MVAEKKENEEGGRNTVLAYLSRILMNPELESLGFDTISCILKLGWMLLQPTILIYLIKALSFLDFHHQIQTFSEEIIYQTLSLEDYKESWPGQGRGFRGMLSSKR